MIYVLYRRQTIVRLETHPIRLEVSAFLFLLSSQWISGMLVRDRFKFKMETFPSCVYDRLRQDRRTRTASDGRRPWQIIWKQGFTIARDRYELRPVREFLVSVQQQR